LHADGCNRCLATTGCLNGFGFAHADRILN
jgi:hypothetical protein